MYAFTYQRPETLRQAVNLLSKNEEAKLIAGGHTLLPTMKLRLASPSMLIDISRIEGLAGIELKGRALTIGAMTRHNDVHTSPVAQQAMIHESRIVEGRSTMRPRATVPVAPGKTVRFAPGGLHIMLTGLKRKLTPGEDVPLLLELQGGASLAVSAHVRALGSD